MIALPDFLDWIDDSCLGGSALDRIEWSLEACRGMILALMR